MSSPHPCQYDMRWDGINGLSILGGNYFIIFTGVWLPCSSFTIFYCSCSLLNCQEVGHPGIYPRCCLGIYLFLLYHIYDVTYHGSPQNNRDLCHKIWQVQDHQGYLVLTIALDSIHLKPIWWHSLKVRSMHSPGLHRWLIHLPGLTGALYQRNYPHQNLAWYYLSACHYWGGPYSSLC